MSRLRQLSHFGQSARIDYISRRVLTDGGLQRLIAEDGVCGLTSNPAIFEKAIAGGKDYREWHALQSRGAGVQRLLWGSTSTKNPAYPDTLYVDELIGRDSVNTLPPATLDAFRDYAVSVPQPGAVTAEATRVMGSFLRDVMKLNDDARNFRVVGPDETASNRLGALFEVTGRTWFAERLPEDDSLVPDGRVMEILSEHTCQGWLEGYLLTGRHGLFSCYEAFIHIVDSMFNQHAKCANHKNLHVRGYKQEGTTTTPFDMAVLNDLDRFHLVADVIDRVPRLGYRAAHLKQLVRDKLIEHWQYIRAQGQDMPEICEWRWRGA